jgi:threonine/homoserine/homoserine lactone efflux protein
MSMPEQVSKVASTTIEALKAQPLALALIVVNVLFLLAGIWIMHDVAARFEARNERFDKVLDRCMEVKP